VRHRQGRRSAYVAAEAHAHGLWPVAIQPHAALVCRFNGPYSRNPRKYMDDKLLLIYRPRRDGSRVLAYSWLTTQRTAYS